MSVARLNDHDKVAVAAVVVVYNDYPSLVRLASSLSDQVDSLIIIDNSDDGGVAPATTLNLPTVIYQQQAINNGLGAGLNKGIALALEGGVDWVMLLDQDSVIADGMVGTMLSAYYRQPDLSAIAMLCPDVFLTEKVVHQFPLSFSSTLPKKISTTSDEVDFCITSGSLVKSSIFEKVGKMNELFFIDYIDYEFCLKIRSVGYKILFVNEAKLMHSLGESCINSLGIRYTSHSPLRVYYQTRNRLLLVRKYGLRYPSFMIMQLSLFLLKFIKILSLEDQKIKRLGYYFRGIWHAFFKKQYHS